MIGIDSMKSQTVRGRSEEASRSPMEQAAAVALEYLRTTGPIRRNQAMAVFEELAKWTAERAPLGLGCEFTAQNLKEGVAPDVLKEPSGWLSPVWTKAVELEPQWQEGLVQVARVLGYGYTPRLTKVGGSPSYYSLTPVPLTAAVAEEPLPDVDPGGVRYTPETVAAPAAWLSATLRSGLVRWTGGLRWSVFGVVMACLVLALFLLWVAFNQGVRTTRPISLRDLWTLLVLVGAFALVVRGFRFIDELFDMGIVMAPSALTPLTAENVTLELRRRTVDSIGELAFVRYTATCPRCDARVFVFSGGKEFVGRLIGRCKQSPREHVYSFDHFARTGKPLR